MRIVNSSIIVVLLLVPQVALAQAPAPSPPGPPPPPLHEGTAEASFVGVSGNASSDTFGLGGEFIARPGTWVFTQKVSFIRNEADGAVLAQSLLYTPRAQKTITDTISVFAEYTFFRDRFAGVANRNAVTSGVSLKLVNEKAQTLALDVGGGYLNETRLAGANVSSAVYSLGSAYKLKMSATSDLSDDVSLVGSVSNGTDWRLVHGIAITARLSNALSLKVSNIIRYAHFPATGFKTTDTTTSVALVAKFASRP